jgi:hypothetical protein
MCFGRWRKRYRPDLVGVLPEAEQLEEERLKEDLERRLSRAEQELTNRAYELEHDVFAHRRRRIPREST